MKRILVSLGALLMVAYVMVVPVMGQSTGQSLFLSGIEDMPLMAGLTEDTASMLVFDSSAGRYVEAFADGVSSPQAVQAFYDDTLPQLGWEKTAPLSYRREGEALILETLDGLAEPGMIRVHFILSPIK